MCGIFGFVSEVPKKTNIIIDGLKILEYRGYDSWGIAAKIGNKVKINKHIGKIGTATITLPDTTLAIGHTRWATHGGVTNANAHPHFDCSKTLAIVHNGIFENYEEIKSELSKKGHKFISQTDTEVIVHLIEEKLKTQSFAIAVKEAFDKLQGLNAIVAINAKSSEIIAAKNGSPLIIGVGRDGYFTSSDISSILPNTPNVVILKDHEMAVMGKKLQIISLKNGSKIKEKIETIKWDIKEHSKGKFKHYFIKEIHEEPEVIKRIAINALSSTKTLAKLIGEAHDTFMVACGSASYAAIAGVYLFSQIAKKHVNMAVGSEFEYQENFIDRKSLVIPISQSGESIDVIEPVMRVKEKGAKIASLVNVMGSTLYRESDFNVLLESGTEKAVVATKSFTAMISTLILSAYTLGGKQKEGQQLLIKASKNVSEILMPTYLKSIKTLARKINSKEHIYIIGRGLSYPIALEASLKLKEASYAHAEAFPGGELKHGVIALIEKGTPVIVFAPNDETYDEIISNAQEVKVRGAYIIGVGPRKSNAFDEYLPTGDFKHATMIPQVTIAHLLGYYLSLARGVEDPDKPRNLAKSVTVK